MNNEYLFHLTIERFTNVLNTEEVTVIHLFCGITTEILFLPRIPDVLIKLKKQM